MTRIISVLFIEGALMRRRDGGAGCGARGRGRTYPRTREALGHRPLPLRGAALNGCTGGDEGGESCRMKGDAVLCRTHGSTVPGTKERRDGAPRGAAHLIG